MLLLLNTTKTMDLQAAVPQGFDLTEPLFIKKAQSLANKVAGMSLSELAGLMSLSDKLAKETFEKVSLWGKKGQPEIPALFGFTGMLFKHLDASSLDMDKLERAREKLCILSGLYGMLRPFDLIEAYRFEMGLKFEMGSTKNIAAFWKKTLTEHINEKLKTGEAIISVASQEYMKALDVKKLKGPVIIPVFKEKGNDGKYRSVVVHAKKARGALIRYALDVNAENPLQLMDFNTMGWRAGTEPPEQGNWLFTRSAGA